jgi:hypothetical protein
MSAEAEEIEAKNADLDDELQAYEREFAAQRQKLEELNQVASGLMDEVDEKDN